MTRILILMLLFVGTSIQINSQTNSIPSVDSYTINGKKVKTNEVMVHDGPIVVICWASWCKTSKVMLDNISDIYEDWVDDYNVKIYAVSYDDQRSISKVKPLVNSSGWEFEILLDKNADFKRAMGVDNCPFLVLYDKKLNKIYQRSGYSPGDEDDIEGKISNLK